MAHFTNAIDPVGGPIIAVIVTVTQERADALKNAGQPIPTPQAIRALVDTGASCTCVDPSTLAALSLTPTGSTKVNTPSTGATPVTADQYDVRLVIPGAAGAAHHVPLVINAVPVVSSDLALQGIQGLIGRDILSLCVLVYNGGTRTFTLAY